LRVALREEQWEQMENMWSHSLRNDETKRGARLADLVGNSSPENYESWGRTIYSRQESEVYW